MSPDAASPAVAEERVERARADLDHDLDQLGAKLSPKELVGEVIERVDPQLRKALRLGPALAGGLMALLLGLVLVPILRTGRDGAGTRR